MPVPRFSIIIPVHHRREFIRSAVASALSQRLARSEFEVVVVKNFRDPGLDSYLEENKVVTSYTPLAPLGQKIEVALRECTGSVITFLEDDDLYLPGRLTALEEGFREEQTGYIHNAVLLIDRVGNPIDGRFRSECRRPQTLGPNDRRPSSIRDFLKVSPSFNLSSIALRREVVEIARPFLPRINLTCDNLLFYAALRSGFALHNLGEQLTCYRLHRSASWPNDDDAGFLAREELTGRGVVEGFLVILEMVKGSAAEPFADCDLLERRAKHLLSSGGDMAPFGGRDLFRLIRCRLLRRELFTAILAGGVLLRSIAPRIQRRLYARYIRWRISQAGVT
jgi:glycosyltransferase involved in cell wall biosynthesis